MALFVPRIIRKIDKTKLFKISVIATVLSSFLIIPTRNNFILFVITYMLRSIPLGIVGVLGFTFTPDCA
jgi:Na+/melibiose symporter-like transporter